MPSRRKPQQHECPVPLHLFNLSSWKLLLHRRRIIDEIRLAQAYRQNSPPRNGLLQSSRKRRDLRKLRHSFPSKNRKGAAPLRPMSASCKKFYRAALIRETSTRLTGHGPRITSYDNSDTPDGPESPPDSSSAPPASPAPPSPIGRHVPPPPTPVRSPLQYPARSRDSPLPSRRANRKSLRAARSQILRPSAADNSIFPPARPKSAFPPAARPYPA